MAGTFSHEDQWKDGWYGIFDPATFAFPQISGTWDNAGKPASITQNSRNNLVFPSRNGLRSSGPFADVIATNREGGLHGSLQDNGETIRWANGTVWYRKVR